ncbi:MAG: hypothetical protein ACLSGS_03745 [Adlercreutzia sp.]
MGLANKIMYDEVPAGTDPSPREQLIFAVGPLTLPACPGRPHHHLLAVTFTKDHSWWTPTAAA